ncbi:hypothetical protein Tco_1491917 [Tanacetum coccineum]
MSMSVQNHKFHKMEKFIKMAKRLCLVDDLKMLKITMSNTSSRNKLNPEINDHYNILTRKSQEYELKTKDEAWQSQAPRHHGGAPAQTRSERVLEKSNEPPLSEGHTSGSGEGRMEHQFELTVNVLDLKKKKDAQAVEILRLKKRVKGLERQRKSRTSQQRRRTYRQVESSNDDLNEEDASK